MPTDPATRQEAHSRLVDLFQGIGHHAQGNPSAAPDLGGMIGQVEEFLSMPVDLARIFVTMAIDLTDAVLSSLEEAGFVLVKGLVP